jgi:putative transcriptional regulator
MDYLRKHRCRNGMSQDQLARESGVAKPTIQRIEAGKTVPKLDTAQSLAQALGIDAARIIESAGLRGRLNRTLPRLWASVPPDPSELDLKGMPRTLVAPIVEYCEALRALEHTRTQFDAALAEHDAALAATGGSPFPLSDVLRNRRDASYAAFNAEAQKALKIGMRASEAGSKLVHALLRLGL